MEGGKEREKMNTKGKKIGLKKTVYLLIYIHEISVTFQV